MHTQQQQHFCQQLFAKCQMSSGPQGSTSAESYDILVLSLKSLVAKGRLVPFLHFRPVPFNFTFVVTQNPEMFMFLTCSAVAEPTPVNVR